MTLADTYSDHVYSDLITEAEKQGIELGVIKERERIINKILNDKEQRWISNDFDIDEIALRRFIYGS